MKAYYFSLIIQHFYVLIAATLEEITDGLVKKLTK